jgi:hypothetical protein
LIILEYRLWLSHSDADSIGFAHDTYGIEIDHGIASAIAH